MLTNHILISFRRMWRNKTSTFVNVLGLSLGIACAVVIASLLRYEAGFDTHHPKKDRLYRVVTDEISPDRRQESGASVGAMADALMKDVNGVDMATMVFNDYASLITVETDGTRQKFDVDLGVVRASPEFFQMFDIRVLQGSVEGLKEPNTVVLTQSIAERFFGGKNPIGRTVTQDNAMTLTVVGVVADPPAQTHLGFSFFRTASLLHEEEAWMYDWGNLSTNVQCFVLLREGVTGDDVEQQMQRFSELYMNEEQHDKAFHLQPVTAIHLEPEYADGIGRAVSRESLYALALIGAFLLITACVNFVNMATAQASTRAREVGVRKVLGAAPSSISRHFLTETFLTVLLSAVVALIAVEGVYPWLTRKLGIGATFELFDPFTLGILALLLIVMTLASGLYPAFVLRGFMPTAALKGTVSAGGHWLRKGLVIVQFTVSQLLFASLLVVTTQMDHIRQADLGMDVDGVITVPLPENDISRVSAFRNELMSQAGVTAVSFSWSSAISGNAWDSNVQFDDGKEVKSITTDLKFADEHYFETFGLRMAAGVPYRHSDTINEYVVNETFVRAMGLQRAEDAVGRMIQLGSGRSPYPITGVVQDFNISPLYSAIRPTLLAAHASRYYEAGIRVRTSDLTAVLAHIESSWSKAFPAYVFSREFMDERIASFYEQEERIRFLFSLFTGIAILIGCIGLVGLISFVAQRRTKEIGVRKVLGASTMSLLGLISREFVYLIGAAFVVTVPVVYMVMSAWLQNFAFRIEIGPGIFLVTAAFSAAVAALTIGFRAVKAAATNPVENLRYE